MINILDLWPRLDARQIAAFQAVARTGSFARAAETLGYTQPAVSHQIASLERIVGHRLFDRGSGRSTATLTAAGTIFAGHIDVAVASLGCARADLDALQAGENGTLRVGAFQSVSARVLPDLLVRLAAAARSISVELTESADEADLLTRLSSGELDFAFTLLPVDDDQFVTAELLRDPYFLVGPSDGAHSIEIGSLGDLAGTPIVAPRTCRSWATIAGMLRATGVEPRYTFRTDDNFAVKGLVQRGVGVAFLTKLTLELMGDDLRSFPVDHLVPSRRIALTWSRRRALLPLQQLFVSLTRETCRTFGERSAETSALGDSAPLGRGGNA